MISQVEPPYPARASGLSHVTASPVLTGPLSPLTSGQADGFLLGSMAGKCACSLQSSPADAAVPASSAVPTPGPQSCQPREWIGSPCLSLPGPWLLPKDEWVATVVCRGQGDNVLWLTALPSYPFFFYRGASRPPMATYPTPEPAPATTVWLPWPPHPSWVGPQSPLQPSWTCAEEYKWSQSHWVNIF